MKYIEKIKESKSHLIELLQKSKYSQKNPVVIDYDKIEFIVKFINTIISRHKKDNQKNIWDEINPPTEYGHSARR